MSRSLLSTVLLGLISLLPLTSQAHSVWIEKLENGELCVRFAQWGEDFETSPGHLDAFADVIGWVADDKGVPQPYPIAKKSDHFLLGKADGTQPVFAQAPFAVRKLHEDKPARAPIFYCRWQPDGSWEGKPAMTMDIVPTGKVGEACVYFRGKPLADTEVTLFAPASDEQKLKTDAEGRVKVADLSKPGPYLLAVARFSEELAGFSYGVPYAVTSHSASLYWTVKKAE